MAFGVKIKLNVDQTKTAKTQFERQVRALVKSVNDQKIPIKIGKVEFNLTKAEKSRLVKEIRDSVATTDLVIPIKRIDATAAVADLRKQLTTMLSGLSITGLKEFLGADAATESLDRATVAANKLAEAQENVKRKTQEANTAAKELKLLDSSLNKQYKRIDGINDTGEAERMKQQYRELSAAVEAARSVEGDAQRESVEMISQKVTALQQEISATLELQKAAQSARMETERSERDMLALSQRAAALSKQVETYITNNPVAYQQYASQFESIRSMLSSVSGVIDPKEYDNVVDVLRRVSIAFADVTKNAKISGNTGKNFFTTLQEGWKKFGGWSIVTKSMMSAYKMIKNVISAVKELDAAMTELKKVTDLSDEAYNSFLRTAESRVSKIGATLADTVNATADFARLGYDVDDALALAEAALVYKNVGDGIDNVQEATESLISTMKAFYSEADDVSVVATHIIDAFNEVGKVSALR